MNFSVPGVFLQLNVLIFCQEAHRDHSAEPGALGGKGVLEALGSPVLVSCFLFPVPGFR